MRVLLTALLLLCCSSVFSQVTFIRTYGGDKHDFGLSAQQTTDGGYILFGQTSSYGDSFRKMFLVKTDHLGNTVWQKTYGDAEADIGIHVRQTRDGGYILCGAFEAFGEDSLALIRVNRDGDILWRRGFRGSVVRDVGEFVEETSDGGFITVGFTGGYLAEDVLLIRTDAHGNLQWLKTYGGEGSQSGYGVRQTEDGGFVLVGVTNNDTIRKSDCYLIRTNPLGDTLWTRVLGTPDLEQGNSIDLPVSGGFIIGGSIGNYDRDMWLERTDDDGNVLWENRFGGPELDVGRAVRCVSDGGFIMGGSRERTNGIGTEMYGVKTDHLGQLEWERTYSKGDLSDANAVQETSDGGFILFGTTTLIDGYSDMYLVKVNSQGVAGRASGDDIKTCSIVPTILVDEAVLTLDESPAPVSHVAIATVNGAYLGKFNLEGEDSVTLEREYFQRGIYVAYVMSDDKVVQHCRFVVAE